MEQQVVKSNHVIEASYRLTLNEQRLILLCIQQISKGKAITPQTGFNVRASELIDVFGMSQKNAYTELKAVAEVLFNRFLTIYQPDPEEPKLESTRTRWITAIDYIPDEGRVKLYFAHKVIPYISLLEGSFTRYNLEYVANMNSIYGMRFYELFKCWLMGDKSTIKNISIDELKTLLDLKDEKSGYQYPSIKDFKLKVLDRGMEDVNQHTDLQAAYETKKTGRRITHLEFVIKLKGDAKPKREAKRPIPLDAELETIDKPMTKAEAKNALNAIAGKPNTKTASVPDAVKQAEQEGIKRLEELAKRAGVDNLLKAKKIN